MYVRLYHHSVWIGFTLHSWIQQLRSHIISRTTNSPGMGLSLHRQQQSIYSRNFLLLPNLKFITDATNAHSLQLLNNEHWDTTEFSTICFNIIHYGHYPGGLLTWVLSNKNCSPTCMLHNQSMILGKWPTWHTNSFLCIYFIYNPLHVLNTSCSSSGETNCVNTTSGNCHSVLVAVLCARHSHQHRVTVSRGCIDTISLSWWWARCARNMLS
jgi:hypothetical protein